jgi:very-short-patch-repair endonuclease
MKYNIKIVTAFFRSYKIQDPEYEYKFHPSRKWKFDIAFINHKIAIEVDGGIWIMGGHNRGAQIKKDWEKRNTATSMGWKIFYCEPKDLCTQSMADFILKAINS